ncbi:uncharacterized protein NPIL_162871 [Nephila pilipes]|uniref:Uncharacterized protein n=1 Tax=Nephila pilipes TaxID=299642 RepID=A0A8X6QJR9_NEPPI|nr:uncharacterized protein NPIL_162871 [Nephila pilipes]
MSTSRGYVSVSIIKIMREADPEPCGFKDNLSWTFSVVDVNGVGKYYQSFVKENVAHFHYDITIPKLLERAVLLNQSDEFLPEDVLTLRIELSCMSYIGPSIQKDIPVDIQLLKEVQVMKEDDGPQQYADPSETFMPKMLECDSGKLFMIMLGVLKYILVTRKRFFINATNAELHKDLLLLSDPMDDIKSTYLGSNPIFQLINALKRRLVKEFEDSTHLAADVLAKEDQYLQKLDEVFDRMEKHCEMPNNRFVICKLNGALPPLLSWTVRIERTGNGNSIENHKPQKGRKYRFEKEGIEKQKVEKTSKECLLEINVIKDKIISEVNLGTPKVVEKLPSKSEEACHVKLTTEELRPDKSGIETLQQAKDDALVSEKTLDKYKSLKNDIDFIKEVISYLMTEKELTVDQHSDNATKNVWHLNIETMDGVMFSIPFENSKEPFGSKLVSCSPVFESMLKLPMREKLQKMVKLLDTNSQTFIHLLNYLKWRC